MLRSHEEEIRRRMAEGVERTLEAMGEAGTAAVRDRMANGYERPIRRSGALMESIGWAAEAGAVSIGSNLPYAEAVHNGTSRTAGRPFLADGLGLYAEEIVRRGGEALAEAMR